VEFQQHYLTCLAQASYLVGDGGECAIVDPRRDIDVYLDGAAALGMTITHIIETHLHADFVSGHLELAARTGATIHVGHRAGADYEHVPAHDGDEIVMGDVTLRFLETPGHTPESVCVLVFDRSVDAERPLKVLTGDTLFIGDAGRPDLVSSKGLTAEDMAGMMYDSLHDKLMVLPDETEVFPGHGAGSACGRAMSSALSCTIGVQKQTNWALQPQSREEFIASQTVGLPPAPRYFPVAAELNRSGPPLLSELPALALLDADALAAAQQAGALVLDVRTADAFAVGHVPGSVNIGLDGQFASWVGALLIDVGGVVVVAEDEAAAREAVLRMSRVGHHGVAGVLAGGFPSWTAAGMALASHERIDPDAAEERRTTEGGPTVLDVRREPEHEGGHVPGALNLPLHRLDEGLDDMGLDPAAPLLVICLGGYRSSTACSLLERRGFTGLIDIRGGTRAWVDAGLPVEQSAAAEA